MINDLSPRIALRFQLLSGTDYDCCDEVLPYTFEIVSYQGRTEFVGDLESDDDLASLQRFIAFKLKKDNIDRDKFIKTIKRVVNGVIDHFNTYNIQPTKLNVYGIFNQETGLLEVQNYEYEVLVPQKHFGSLVDGKKSKELIFAANKNVELLDTKVEITKPLVVTDSTEAGGQKELDGYLRIIKLQPGKYNVYTVCNYKYDRIALCLVHEKYDFYSVFWRDQQSYISDKMRPSYWIIGEKDRDFIKDADFLMNHNEKAETLILNNYIAAWCNMDTSEQFKDKWQFATYYLAHNSENQIIGIAFDLVGYGAGKHINLNNLIR